MNLWSHRHLAAALSGVESAAIITQVNSEASVVVKAPRNTVEGFRGALVWYRYELGLMPEGPVLCLFVRFYDNPAPYQMETFLNLADEDDLRLARLLAEQEHLTFHFFDERLEYVYSKQVPHRERTKRELRALVERGLSHLKTVGRVDFPAAKERFMREVRR